MSGHPVLESCVIRVGGTVFPGGAVIIEIVGLDAL